MTAGRIRGRYVPCLRGLDSDLRCKRLLAARQYAPRSIPRAAILLGHWDGGAIVGLAAKRKEHGIDKGRSGKNRAPDSGKKADAKRRRQPRTF